MTATSQRATPRLDNNLADWVTGRQRLMSEPENLSDGVRSELVMWRALLDLELSRIRLTLDELGVIASVCHATVIVRTIGRGQLAWDLRDAAAYGHHVPGDLIDKLDALSPAADHALTAAVAQWWTGEHEHSIDGWATVGVRALPGG